MIFSDAIQAIRDAYDVKYGTCWQVSDDSQVAVPLRRYCPFCYSHLVTDLGKKPVRDNQGEKVLDSHGNVKVRQQYRCGRCKKPFNRPSMMMPRRSGGAGHRARVVDSGWRICNSMEVGQVRSVVEGLDWFERDWLWLVYTAGQDHAGAKRRLFKYLCDCVDADPPCDIEGVGAFSKLIHLLVITLEEAGSKFNGGDYPWSLAQIANRLYEDEVDLKLEKNPQVRLQPGRPLRAVLDCSRQWLIELNRNALEPVNEEILRLQGRQRSAG